MIYRPETVKGFRDYLAPESLIRDKLKKIAEKNFKLYGFQPIETPLVEFDELMRSDSINGEDEAIADRFRLKDKGGRNLGLRYEFTFQLARIFKLNPNLKLPFRRYQIGENFRDEPIRLGRFRQFTQCDIDIVGDPTVNADAECIAVASDILNELKVKEFEIRVNNRKLMDEIVNSVKIKETKQVMKELDKLDKIGEDDVKANLRKYADSTQILTLFKLMEKDIEFFTKNMFEGATELADLISACEEYGIKVKFSPSLVRGLSYYTGNIFEFVVNKTSVFGGGRYDDLVGKYLGRQIPAVGISFSLESMMALFEEEISKLKLDSIPEVIIASINKDKDARKLAKKLRKASISCMIMQGAGKSLEYANSQSTPFVLFIGNEEVQSKKYKLKEMKSGKEQELTEKQLVAKFAEK